MKYYLYNSLANNGIRPNDFDQYYFQGYAGFPFDLVPKLSLGLIYHFN